MGLKLIRSAFLGVVLLLVASCGTKTAGPGVSLEDGLRHYERGNYQEAERVFTRLIEADPDRGKAYYLRGRTRFNLDRSHDAIRDFNRAIEHGHETASVYYYRGGARARLKQFDQALQDVSRATEIDSRHVQAYYKQAQILMRREDFDRAAERFRTIIQLDTGFHEPYEGLGVIKAKQGDYDSAVRYMSRALSRVSGKRRGHLYRQRAKLWRAMDEYDSALRDIDRLLKVDPGDSEAHIQRAKVLGAQQQYQRANEALSPVLALDSDRHPRHEALVVAAGLDRTLDRPEKALEHLDDVMRYHPDTMRLHFMRMKALLQLNRTDEALTTVNDLLERSAEQSSFRSAAYYWKAKILKRQGRREDALTNVKKALAIDSGPQKVRALYEQLQSDSP